MWRRTYLLLLLVRIYFAVSTSYLHPDENFQGPEVVAGSLFLYPAKRTWEWTSSHPIRSVFPLWPVYGLPMILLEWCWAKGPEHLVEPIGIYYTLRLVMFALSFVLEDWAIHDLVHSPKQRRLAVILAASSYVTWTFQTHTFSNSVETLAVLWSLVLTERIGREQKRSSIGSSFLLGFLLVFGTFNRITFPAFIVIPGIRLLPHFLERPFCLVIIVLSGLFWMVVAVATDTAFYVGPTATTSFRALFNTIKTKPVITPLNNLMYNTQTSNLAEHGLHPHYQHLVANLPQLLGPAFIVLIFSIRPLTTLRLRLLFSNPRLASAVTGTLILSVVPHQEPRFLLPCVPLLLTCLRVPSSPDLLNFFWATWAIFNIALAVLMGTYHQGGIIPAQLALPNIITNTLNATNPADPQTHNIEIFWWRTYPPPTYLLGSAPAHPHTNQTLNISTVPLMGIPQSELVFMLMQHVPTCDPSLIERLTPHGARTDVFVAAPLSAWRDISNNRKPILPPTSAWRTGKEARNENFSFVVSFSNPPVQFGMRNLALFSKHINLDDLDMGEDGVLNTLSRVVGRRGLGVWKVDRICGVEERNNNE